MSGLTDATAVAADYTSACALRRTGAVLCWGDGGLGELGSTLARSSVPVAVPSLTDATGLQASGFTTCATRASGPAVCWGSGEPLIYGQSGVVPVASIDDGGYVSSGGTVCVTGSGGAVSCAGSMLADGSDEDSDTLVPATTAGAATALTGEAGHICALVGDGQVECWGSGSAGQLGTGGAADGWSATYVQSP